MASEMMTEEPDAQEQSGNEYDSIVQDMKAKDAARAPLRQSFSAAREISQQDAIKALELSDKTGIAPQHILRNLDYVGKKSATPQDRDYDDIVTNAPMMGGWLRDPLNAAAVQGDVENLKRVEKSLAEVKYAPLQAQPDEKLMERARARGKESGASLFRIQEEEPLKPEDHPFAAEDLAQLSATPKRTQEDFERQETEREYARLKALEDFVSDPSKITAVERLTSEYGIKNQTPGIPFLASFAKLSNGVNLIAAANRYESGEASPRDLEALQEVVRIQMAEERRGTTIPAKMLDTALGVTEFAGEVMATGGLSSVGKKLVLGGVEEASVGLLKRVLAKMAGTLVQLPVAGITAIPANVAERMTPQGQLSVDDSGALQYSQTAGESILKAIPKAVVSRFADQYSAELFGLWSHKVPGATMETFKKSIAKEGAVEVLKFIGMGEVAQLMKEVAGAEPWRAPTVVRAMMGDGHAVEELIATTGVGFAMGAGGAMRNNRAIERAEAQSKKDNVIRYNDILKQAGDQIAETAIFKKSPAIAERAVAASLKDTPNEFQRVSAAAFEQKLLQAGIEPHTFAAELTGQPEALKDALELGPGGKLKVPTAAVISRIHTDPKLSALFQGEFVENPLERGVSDAELHLAKLDAEMQAERKAAKEQKEAAKVEKAAKEPGPGDVKDFASIQGKDVAAQAEQSGRPKQEASLIGKLVESIYRTLGNRGSTPAEEMGQKHGPIIEAGKAEGTERGAYIPPDITKRESFIQAMKGAGPSTIPHELAHHVLDILAGDPKLAGIFERFLKYRGIESPEAWGKMSLEEKRPHHEAFAGAYEDYLFHGEAPSRELRSVFHRYRELLAEEYQKHGKAAKEISPELRDIFERTHATDEEIKAAKERLGKLEPHLAKVKSIVLDAASADRLAELVADANRAATERLDKEALDEVNHQRSDEYKKIKEEVRESVSAQVDATPNYRTKSIIETGMEPDGTPVDYALGGFKFSREILKEKYGKDVAGALPKEMVQGEGGNDPDFMAEMLGYSSGMELVQKMSALESRESLINRLTADTMSKMRLDPIETLPQKAREAIHNDAEQKLNLYQAEWVAKNRLPQMKELIKKLSNPKKVIKEVREYAEKRVGRDTYRKADPREFEVGEREAHRAATDALTGGNFTGFITFIEKEILNHELYRAAVAARENAEKVVGKMKGTRKNDFRSEIFTANPEHLAQIDALNDQYSFSNEGVDSIERKKSLREFVEGLTEDDYIVQIPDKVLDAAYRTNWKDVPLDHLQEIADSVDHIAHLADLKNTLREGQKKRKVEVIADQIVSSVEANSTGPVKKSLNSYRPEEQPKRNAVSAKLSVRNLSDLMREMDGLKDGGILQHEVLRRMNDAGTDEAVRNEKYTQELKRVFSMYSKAEQLKLHRKIFIPELNDSLTKEEAIVAMMHLGQEGAESTFAEGRQWGPEQLEGIKKVLDKKDWEFVREMKKVINADRAEVKAQIERETGLPAKMVEAVPVETPFGEIEGGYFPKKYDFRLSSRGEELPEVDAAKRARRAASLQATTKHGYRDKRITEGTDYKLRLDFGTIYEHLAEKAHDLAYHEPLREVNTILRNQKVKDAIRNRFGDQMYAEIKAHLNDIATGEISAENFYDRSLNHIRRGAVASSLAFNALQFFTDMSGMAQGAVRVGPKWMAKGMAEFFGSPTRMQETVEQIHAESPMMRLRATTKNREINEIRNRVAEKGLAEKAIDLGIETATAGKLDLDDMHDGKYYLMTKAQLAQEMPLYIAAKLKAREMFPADPAKGKEGFEEANKKWISVAEQAVLDSFGGGQMKDLANIQKGGATKKLVYATFYSFASRSLNLMMESALRERLKYNKGEKSAPAAAGRVIADYSLIFALPALYGTIVKSLLPGSDDSEFSDKVKTDQATAPLRSVPLVREFASEIEGRNYSGPAGLRLIPVLGKAWKKVNDGEFPAREINQAGGILFHYPALQAQRSADGLSAIIEGKTKNPLSLLFGWKGKR